MRFFENLAVGERRSSPEWLLSPEQMVRFSAEFDPQPVHLDGDAASRTMFGQLIASGIHLLAIARRLDQDMNGDIAFLCGLGFEDVRFLKPGLEQDRLVLSSEILSLRLSTGSPDRGVVTHAFELAGTQGEMKLMFRGVSLVACESGAQPRSRARETN
jgi:acyl dehydratase